MANAQQTDHPTYETIVETVSSWPASERLHLVQAILGTLESALPTQPRRKVPAREAEGLLAGPWPTPTDEDVKRLVGDYLTEKYD